MVPIEDAGVLRDHLVNHVRGAMDIGIWLIYTSCEDYYCGLSDIVTYEFVPSGGSPLPMGGLRGHVLYQFWPEMYICGTERFPKIYTCLRPEIL